MTQFPNAMPAEHQTERELLGSVIFYPSIFYEVQAAVSPTLWHDPRHVAIWKAIQSIGNASERITLETVAEKLRDSDQIQQAGGYSYLSEVSNCGITATLTEKRIQRLKLVDKIRQIIDLGAYMVDRCRSAKFDEYESLIASITERCMRLSHSRTDDSLESVERTIPAIRSESNNGKDLVGIVSTGMPMLDRLTHGGLSPSHVTVIGAAAGSGKSTLANTIATNAALAGRKVAIFSLEDTKEEWHRRTLCRLSDMPYAAFKLADKRTSEMLKRLDDACDILAKCKIWVSDASRLDSSQALSMALAKHAEVGLDLVVVDHLIEFGDKADNSHMRITNAIKNMRTLAMQAKIPVLVLTQVNREGKLRESGSIEEVCRSVWRLETDAPAAEDRAADHEQEIHRRIRVVKTNQGEPGTVNLWTNFKCFQMREWEFGDGEWVWRANGGKVSPVSTVFRPGTGNTRQY